MFMQKLEEGKKTDMTPYNNFNKGLLDFIRDLAKSFPQVDGFRTAYASTNLMAMLNPTMIQGIFHKHCQPFVDRIIGHDDAFFLEKDYATEMAGTGESIEIVSIIKNIWGTLDQSYKDTIWRHMEVLVALSFTITGGENLVSKP